MFRILIIATLVCAGGVGCRSAADSQLPRHWPIREELGAEAVGVVLRAEHVECWRIKRVYGKVESKPGTRTTTRSATPSENMVMYGRAPYLILYRLGTPAQKIRRELAESLLAESSYVRQLPNEQVIMPCGFQPGVLYRFSKGERTVAVLICFDCEKSEIYLTGFAGDSAMKNKLPYVAPYCTDGINRILMVTQQIFPNDADIQTMSPKVERQPAPPSTQPDTVVIPDTHLLEPAPASPPLPK